MARPRRLARRKPSNSSGKSVTSSKVTCGVASLIWLPFNDHLAAGSVHHTHDRGHQGNKIFNVARHHHDILSSVPEDAVGDPQDLPLLVANRAPAHIFDEKLSRAERWQGVAPHPHRRRESVRPRRPASQLPPTAAAKHRWCAAPPAPHVLPGWLHARESTPARPSNWLRARCATEA